MGYPHDVLLTAGRPTDPCKLLMFSASYVRDALRSTRPERRTLLPKRAIRIHPRRTITSAGSTDAGSAVATIIRPLADTMADRGADGCRPLDSEPVNLNTSRTWTINDSGHER